MEPTELIDASDTDAVEAPAGDARNSSRKNCSSRRSPSTACAASTDPAFVTAAVFDADRAYRCEQVALRPEPFGALAYHYGNRRLNFLRAKELVTLVESLADHDSVQAAFDASDRSRRWPSFEQSASPASDFLVPDA